MKNILLYLIACLFLYSCSFWEDKHPDYPYGFVDNVNFHYLIADSTVERPHSYMPVTIGGETLYLQDSCVYDIRGNLVKTSSVKHLVPCFKNYARGYYGKMTSQRYYIFESDKLYLFDFENDRLVKDIMKVRFKDYEMEEFSDELMERFDSLQIQFPEIPLMPGHWMYANRWPKDKEKFDKQVMDNYKKTVRDFIGKNKNEGCLFSSDYDSRNPFLVFPQKGLAFVLDSIQVEGFPPLTAFRSKPVFKTEKPPVSFQYKGRAFLGYREKRVFGIPFPESNGYIHYWKLSCDEKTFNYKAETGWDYYIYDYEITDDTIYFALSDSECFNEVTLYQYDRKAK